MINSINDLTQGELFWVWRRREGLHSYDAAVRFGVGLKTITAWERDRAAPATPPAVALTEPLTIGERAALLRRRAGRTVKGAAKLIGISHVSLIKREADEIDASDVLHFWEAYLSSRARTAETLRRSFARA